MQFFALVLLLVDLLLGRQLILAESPDLQSRYLQA